MSEQRTKAEDKRWSLSAFSIIKPAFNPNAPIIVFPTGEWEAAQPEGLVAVFADLPLPSLLPGELSVLYPLIDSPLQPTRQLGRPLLLPACLLALALNPRKIAGALENQL